MEQILKLFKTICRKTSSALVDGKYLLNEDNLKNVLNTPHIEITALITKNYEKSENSVIAASKGNGGHITIYQIEFKDLNKMLEHFSEEGYSPIYRKRSNFDEDAIVLPDKPDKIEDEYVYYEIILFKISEILKVSYVDWGLAVKIDIIFPNRERYTELSLDKDNLFALVRKLRDYLEEYDKFDVLLNSDIFTLLD